MENKNIIDDLVDRKNIKIDIRKNKEGRIKQYLEQIKDPYCYLDNNTIVKVRFSDTDITIEDCISNYLKGV